VSKGVEYLVEAAKRVRKELPNSRLIMILSREPAGQYRRVMKSIEALGDHVMVVDSVPRAELPSYLLAAGCVVVPSISEGFGYSAIEAALLGCPLIATSGHATEELLGDYATFVPPRNTEALARAIIEAATIDGRSGRRSTRRFTAEAHADGVIRVYSSLGS
jgi:glycosyltransferase involved in cell wall biosynthesis